MTGGGKAPITLANGNPNSNYSVSYTGANLAITPAPLTITPTATSKTYGDSDPTLTYTTSGYVNSDTSALKMSRIAASTSRPM